MSNNKSAYEKALEEQAKIRKQKQAENTIKQAYVGNRTTVAGSEYDKAVQKYLSSDLQNDNMARRLTNNLIRNSQPEVKQTQSPFRKQPKTSIMDDLLAAARKSQMPSWATDRSEKGKTPYNLNFINDLKNIGTDRDQRTTIKIPQNGSTQMQGAFSGLKAPEIITKPAGWTSGGGGGNQYDMTDVGNIDLSNRKIYRQPDGSISTLNSISFYDDDEKKEILVPTIVNGEQVSEEEAIDRYYQTGEHLGKFKTAEGASKFAEKLHKDQERMYADYAGPQMKSQDYRTWSMQNQLKTPGSKINEMNRIARSNPKLTRDRNFNGTYKEWTSEDERNLKAWEQEARQYGMLNSSDDPQYWSDEKLQGKLNTARAEQEKEKEQRDASSYEQDGNLQGLLRRMYIDGMEGIPVYESGYSGGWEQIGEIRNGRPEDYYTRYDDGLIYDEYLFDAIEGRTGAFREMLYGTDEQADYALGKVEEYWDILENSETPEEAFRKIKGYDSDTWTGSGEFGTRANNIRKWEDELGRRETVRGLEEQSRKYQDGAYHEDLNRTSVLFDARRTESSEQNYFALTGGDKTDQAYYRMNHRFFEANMEGPFGNWSYIGEKNQEKSEDASEVYFMTDEQVEVFNRFYNAGDKKNAQAYLDGLEYSLLSARADYLHNYDTRRAADLQMGWLTTLESVAQAPISGIKGTYGAIAAMFGDKNAANPNSRLYDETRENMDIRQTRGKIWGEGLQDVYAWATGEKNNELAYRAGNFLYGVFTSVADNLYSVGISAGLTGGTGAFAQTMTQLIMSSSAAATAMVENLEKYGPLEAGLMAIGSGMIEAVTEKYSIEALLSDPVNLKGYLLKNTFTEGTEEVASDLLNTAADTMASLIFGHKTEIEETYEENLAQLKKQGIRGKAAEQQAMEQTLLGYMGNLAQDFLAGAMSGAMMSGGRGGINATQDRIGSSMATRKYNSVAARSIVENGKLKDLATIASQRENEETKAAGQKVLDKLEKGKKVGNRETRDLFTMLSNETNESIRNIAAKTFDQSVNAFLKDTYGVKLDAKLMEHLTEVIRKSVMDGSELSRSDRNFLAQHPAATELIRDMTAEQNGVTIDANKRSAGMTENIRNQIDEATKNLVEEARSIRDMAKTPQQREFESFRDEIIKKTERAGNAVKTAGDKMVSAESAKAIIDSLTAEARNAAKGGAEADAQAKAKADVDAIARKTIVFQNENGEDQGGTLVGVETKTVDADEGQKAGPRTDRPAGYVAQDADREGPAAESVAETAPEAEQKAPSKKRLVRQYVVRTADGTEIRTDAVTAKAADVATAAAMTFIETSDMSDREATDLLDVVTGQGVKIGEMEALLKDARNVMTRGWLGMTFPAEIGYKPEAARALYEKGQAQKITDEETRTGGKRTTLNPGQGQVTYRGVDVKTLDGEVRKQVEAAAAIAKRVGYNIIFENDTKNTNRYGEYDAATGSVIINIAGKHQNGQAHHLMVAMSHEVTHMLERNSPEAYAQLREFVFKEMQRNGVDLVARIGQKVDNYNYQIRQMRQNGRNISDITIGGAAAEVVADACDQVFGNEKLITRLANENPTLFDKVKNAIADFIGKVRDAARGMRESGSLDSATIRDVDKLAEKWGIALEEVRTGVAPAAAESQQNAENAAEAQLSVMELDNGIKIAVEDRNILIDKPASTSMADYIREYIWSQIKSKNGRAIVEATGDVVFLSKDLPGEYTESRYTKQLQRGNRKKYDIKGRMAGVLLDMIKTANNKTGPEIVKHNNGKAAQRGVYKFATKVALPVTNNGEINGYNVYNAKLIVNHSGNGKMELYDVYDINKDDATTVLLNRRANTYKGGQPDSAVTKGSINQNDGKSNNQLSLEEAERESGYENEKMARASVATDQNGERIFSLASMEHDRDLYRQMLVGSGILKDKEIEDLFQTIDKAMGTIRKDRAILDMNETFGKDERAFLPVKPNSDPLYQVSLDFSTLCRKRLLQQALQEMIEKKYKTVMTKAERVAMRNALQQLQKEGKRIEIACALCYVESARLKSPAQIQKFMENKRGYIVDYLSKSKKDYKQKIDAAEAAMKVSFGYDAKTSLKDIKKQNSAHERAIRAMKRRMYQEYAPTAQEESIIRAAETMDESMYKTAAGLAKLKRDYPMVFDAFTTSVRNATKSKGIEGDTPFYAGDTKSISDELIERMNKENGLRSQSWSDFQTYHILDYMGAIIELSTRKAKMQAYTKVPDYIRLMGLTGQMINASLIPMDYNGENLQYDPKEGMPYEIAQQLRDQYPDTVGNICIGISDDHIRALLANDDIDYVIPYHKSSMDKKTRQRMGLKNWSEYESQQNEKPQDYANTDKKGKDYQKKPDFSEWYNYQEASEIARAFEASGMSAWDASKLAMQEMANRYIQLCHERGLQEKFANFSGEDGYWKLLIDRKMINQKTGKLIEQQAVRPIFDSAVIEDILKNEVQQVRETQPDIEEATDAILKQWEAGDIQKAARTKEVQDAVRAFDDHMVVQNVVEMFRDEQQKPEAAAAEAETTEETEDTEEDMPIAAAMSLADISEIQEKQQELYRTRDRVHEIETSKELQDAITKAMKEGDFDDYNEILSRTKLADLKRKVSRLEDEIQKWQKEYEEERNRKNLSREQQAIAKSGLTEPEYRNRQAVKQFGTTTNPNEAAYIIRNGSMLNFSGEKGQHTNHRGNDHRMIGIIYEDDNIQGSKAMYTFMNDGNIRIMPESPGIEVTSRTEPTAEQYRTLRRVINQIGGDGFSIDFCDENGHNIDSIMYDGRANGEKAIADIKHFYETGEVRQPSELSRFFSVAEEGMAASDWIMAMDPNDIDMGTKAEKALVRNYQKTRREVESIEARIAEMKEALKTAKGDEARKLRINLQTEQNKLKRARDMLNGLTSGREFSYMLRRAQESISYLMGMKSQEDVNKAADRMRDKAEEMRRTATEAAGMLEKIADREEAAVQRRYFNNDALRGAAAELGEYFGIKDTSRIEDGLVEIGLKMIAKDPGFAESLDRMSSRILEDMYGTAALMEGSNNKAVYGSQLSDITVQVLKATQKYVPGMKSVNITTADRAEVQGLLDYVKQIGSMTRQAAKGMQRVAGMAQELKQETENTKAATAEIRRKLATAIRYYDNLNKQSDALASAERMERTIRQIESKAAKQVLEAQLKFQHTIENDRNVRRLANENLRERHKINTAYTRMAKLILNESDQKNIPAHMQPIARAAIRMILNNDTSGRKLTGQDWQTMIRSRNTLELIDKRDGTELNLNALVDFELIDQGGDDVAVAIEEALQEIDEGIRYWNSGNGRTAVALEGDKAALARISKGMTQIYDIVTRSQQIFLDGKQVDLANAAYEVDAEARKKGPYREFTGGLGKLVKGLNKNAVLANMTPEYFFKNLKNNGLSRIFDEFKNGEDRYGRILLEAKKKIEAAAEKAGYSSWDMDAKHAIQLDNGRTVNMTLGQMMSLMATWKRENTLGPEMSQHLTKGGFVIEEASEKKIYGREARNQTPNRVTEHDMEEIGNMLTAEQKTYVDEMVQILTKDMGRYGNEASMRMYGIEKYKETYYFPFQIWSGVKNKDSAAGSVNPTNNNRAAHMSFTNRRKANASNAVMIRDFNQVCAEHINQMATYATFGSAIEGMNRVLNYRIMETGEDGIVGAVERNIENLLVQQYGEDAVNYLRQFMKDLNGGAVQKNTDIGQRLMSMFKKNAVGGSLSVALQQPLSYIRASTMIEVKNLQRADARCKAHLLNREWWKNEYEEMAAHSGVAVIKDMGKFDMSFSMGAADWLTPDNRETGIRKVYNKVEEITNALPEKMDQITWIKMWNAIKIEQAAANPGVDQQSDEFLDAVGKRFNDVMRKTQVYDSVLVKSELMRNTGWVAKTITAFRAEPTVTLNMFMDAWMNRKEAGGKKNAAAVMATFLLGAIAQAAVKGIMGAGRNPDEKKTLAENFAYRFGSAFLSEANPLGLIPGMDNIITALSGNDINDNAWGMIKTFSKSLKTIWNLPTGEKLTLDSGYRYIEDTVGQITQMMSGVPAKNLMRDSRAVYNWFLGEGYSDREHWGKDKDGNRVRIPGRERTANDISVPLLGYANRNVMKYQLFDQLAGDNLMAMLNATTGLNVWDSSSTAYTQRIYEAERDGNRDAADAYREYMTLGKGKEKKDIDSAVASAAKKDSSLTTVQKAEFLLENEYTDKTSWITEQYKKGELTEEETRKLYGKYFPDKNPDDMMWNYEAKQYKEGGISQAEAKAAYMKYHPKKKEQDWNDWLWGIDSEKFREGNMTEAEAKRSYLQLHPKKNEQDWNDYLWSSEWKKYKEGTISEAEAKRLYQKYHPNAKEKDMASTFWGLWKTAYKDGEISRTEAERRYKQYYPKANADDIFSTFDALDYTKDTGKTASGDYYRMHDAIEQNNSAEIAKAVESLTKHGKKKNGFESSIKGKWMTTYNAMQNGSAEKVRLRDGITKAMKAAGFSTKEIDKMFTKWAKTAEKEKK